jgi:hypothetical protein
MLDRPESTVDLVRDDLNDAASVTDIPEAGKPYAVFGSLVMLFHGLRDEIGDVDVFAAPSLWEVLANRPPGNGLRWSVRIPDPLDPPILEAHAGGLTVHAFYRWQERDFPAVDADACRQAAEFVHGWWCTPLWLIRQHKAHSLAQPGADTCPRQVKHRRDLVVIDERLRSRAA